jgi:hypothetical protein
MTNTNIIKTKQWKVTSISIVGSRFYSSDKVGYFFIVFQDVNVVAILFFLLLAPFILPLRCFEYFFLLYLDSPIQLSFHRL